MFFLMPLTFVSLIYVAAAIVPAVFLLRYIYKMDTYEKEPGYLLRRLFIRGILAALCSIVLETIGQMLLNASPLTDSAPIYIIVMAFLVIAVAEEGTKFLFLYRKTWKDPNFNYRFDAIVYSAFVSLGFAAFENVEYVFEYGLSVALPRAVLSVPGHLGFSVVMGYFYGRARMAENNGEYSRAVSNMTAGFVGAVLMHGFYDACAMMQTGMSTLLFVVFVIIMYVVIYRLIKKESRVNEPI